jgi:hypothetical protein
MQVNETSYHSSVDEYKEEVESALARAKSLKCRVSELIGQCEVLKKLQSETRKDLTCSECGKLIEQGQEVALKGSFGKVKTCYHKDCFKAIWRSQTWIFDYSSPGFLRISVKHE